MIYFTSDLHFEHENIIRLCSRPFRDATEMNNILIYNWNNVVRDNDIVYILGDITMNKDPEIARKYLERMTGKKTLIQGNHDYFVKNYRAHNFDFFEEVTFYKEINYNKQRFVLMHYPLLDWNHMYRGSYMLHGHMHNKEIYNYNNKISGIKRYDVGVDANNFTPVSIDKIMGYFK